jgi:hypothetical protein
MTEKLLLAVCAVLIGFGTLTIAVSAGFSPNLLGAGIMALGGSAASPHSIPSSATPPLLVPDAPKMGMISPVSVTATITYLTPQDHM